MNRRVGWFVLVVFALTFPGCSPKRQQAPEPQRTVSTIEQTMECLKRGLAYEHNAIVRVEAIESLGKSGSKEALPWIRSALLDESAAVRFAACLALGEMKDQSARDSLLRCLNDPDRSVKVATLGAMHCLGDTSRTGMLASYLLDDEDPYVRRNAALVLGRLGEPKIVKMLARGMKDKDEGVQSHVLEAMALLGNPEARQQLAFMANSGLGSEEVFAINALAEMRDRVNYDIMMYKLDSAIHLETKLAAARGLGMLGAEEGYGIALDAIDFDKPQLRDEEDSAEGQILRTRLLALSALGAIGKEEAIPHLEELMLTDEDPRIQVSAAKAILEITSGGAEGSALFRSSQKNGN